jgi:hypothetical protein
MSFILDWICSLSWINWAIHLHWERIGELFIGEKIAIGTLLAVTVIESVVASNRFLALEFATPKTRKSVKTPRRKKGFGLKHAALLLIALLPGGLVGSFVIYTIMGKEDWRRDTVTILGVSLLPVLLLALLRASWFPWPEFSDAIYISGLFGLIFALLHVWAMIKLLREWWGEPDECVAWWPPLTLWMQALLLWAMAYRILC